MALRQFPPINPPEDSLQGSVDMVVQFGLMAGVIVIMRLSSAAVSVLMEITLDEVVRFRELLDARVIKLLSSRPEDFYDVVKAGQTLHTMETPAAYLSCKGCRQQVLKEHAVELQGKRYCVPCWQRLESCQASQGLH
jgi:formylmethanofuran dehydrogenase subunit E